MELGALLECALQEAADIANFINAIVGNLDNEAQLVESICSCTSGSKKLVAAAINQNDFYRSELSKCRETSICSHNVGSKAPRA